MASGKASKDPAILYGGYGVTGLWLLGIIVYAVLLTPKPLSALDPNELGDFLAGAFAPLAFLWLVLAVFLQMQELRMQRVELAESREAQERLAEETALMAGQSARSVRIAHQTFEVQQAREAEARVDALINVIAKRIRLLAEKMLVRRSGTSSYMRLVGAPPRMADADEVLGMSLTEMNTARRQLPQQGS